MDGNKIQGLERLLEAQSKERLPPVEDWSPAHGGDIGLEIQADGTWLYQDSPIRRDRLVKLFSTVLRRDEDGRHYLVTPVEKIDVRVADAPFLAVEMEREGTGRAQTLIFRTNVDDIVRCGPDHPITFKTDKSGDGLKPYVLVRGRLEALVTRAVTYDLVELAGPRDDSSGDTLGVWSGGAFFPID